MSGKINLYNLGDLGVDLVASPLHAGTGSWQRLQNAEFSNIQGQGGVKKRGSLKRLNDAALNGGASILVLANMPLETDALLATESVWLFIGGSNLAVALWPTFPTSDSFGDFSPLTALASVPCGANGRPSVRQATTIGSTLYFITTGADPGSPTLPQLYSFDGTTLTLVADTTDWPDDGIGDTIVAISDIFTDGTDLYVCATYSTNRTFVLSLAGGTGTPTQFGDLVGGLKVNTNITIGKINDGTASGLTTDSFILLYTANSDSRYRVNIKAPLDVGWSSSGGDNGTVNGAGGGGVVLFSDLPYVGFYGNGAVAAVIRRRTLAGNWATVLTGPSSGTGYGFGFGVVFDSKIFFQFEDPTTGASRMYVSTTGASASWTLDKDFAADFSLDPVTQRLQQPVVFDGDLYVIVQGVSGSEETGKILKRNTAGTWTAVVEDAPIYIAAGLYGA